MSELNNRLEYIDIAKGILIILVVLHHCLVSSHAFANINNNTIEVLYSAHHYLYVPFFMPGFFFITGFCSNFNRPFLPFFVNLTFAIGVPLLFFDIIPYNCEEYYKKTFLDWLISLPVSLLRFFRYSLWFLRVLFVSKLYYWILNKYLSENKVIITTIFLYFIAAIFVMCGYGEHGCHSLMALLFISFGKYCKKNRILENGKIGALYFVGYLLISCIFFSMNRKTPYMTNEIQINDVIDILAFPILGTFGTIAMILIAKKIYNSKILAIVGKYSLVIYCVHMLGYPQHLYKYFLSLIGGGNELFLNEQSCAITICYIVGDIIFVTTICCIFACIVDRPYLRVIIGKRP